MVFHAFRHAINVAVHAIQSATLLYVASIPTATGVCAAVGGSYTCGLLVEDAHQQPSQPLTKTIVALGFLTGATAGAGIGLIWPVGLPGVVWWEHLRLQKTVAKYNANC
jgi:hypothetical protein